MTGMPVVILPWWGAVVETYVQHVLTLAGVDGAHVSVRRGEPEPSSAQVPLTTVELDVFFHA
jgi:hypothetical protein